MSSDRRTPVLLSPLLAASAAFLLSSCGPGKAEPDIKIGVIAELSGALSVNGAACRKAAEMAATEINHTGGIEFGGKHHGMLLVIEDSGSTPEGAAEAARRLIDQEKVVAIVGPNASLGAVPAAKVAEKEKVLLVTPWATAPNVTLDETGTPRKWVFRTCFTDPFEGKALAKFGRAYMRAEKAAVLYDPGSEAPKSQAELFRKDFEAAGGKIVAFETYKTGDKDFSAQMGKIKAAGPDLVFLPAYYTDVPTQLQQARKAGVKVPFLGSDNWANPELIEKAGADVDGSYFCAHYSPMTRSDVVGNFVAAYEHRNAKETPIDGAALTYDTFGLLKKAIADAKAIDREKIRDAFARITSYDGVTGKLRYKPGNPDPEKSAVLMKFEGGKPIFVTNIDPF